MKGKYTYEENLELLKQFYLVLFFSASYASMFIACEIKHEHQNSTETQFYSQSL